MKNDFHIAEQQRTDSSREMYDGSELAAFPSAPLSYFCWNRRDLDNYLHRRILDFRTALPKRFVRYLARHEYPRTIGDLLDLEAGSLLKYRNIGIVTVNKVIRFLNNISCLDIRQDVNDSPDLIPGADIRSCFENPGELFDEWENLKICLFENYLPPRFSTYLKFHPELVTINDLLNLKTDRLLKERSLGKISLEQLLKFLRNIPGINLNPKGYKYNGPETRRLVQEEGLFYCYNIMEIYSRLIVNFCELLTEKESLIFQSKFGEGKNLDEVAAEFCMSRQRVSQIIRKRTAMLKRHLSFFETRLKLYVVQILPEMNSFIDDKLSPREIDRTYFFNLLSYIYPGLPTKANRLQFKRIMNDKYFTNIYRHLKEQNIIPYKCTLRSLCKSMGITDPDDVMNLYRILLCGLGFGLDEKDGVVYVVRSGCEKRTGGRILAEFERVKG